MLKIIQNRTSIPAKFLVDPAPSRDELEGIIRAAVSAPDHGALRPWRFIVIEGERRVALGDVFARALTARDPLASERDIQRQRDKPLRSPLILIVVARISADHPKVPEIEQILSAGAAAQNLQLAANTMGYHSIWLTGPNASDSIVKSSLDIADKDRIVGFIYIGTSKIRQPNVRRPEPSQFVQYW